MNEKQNEPVPQVGSQALSSDPVPADKEKSTEPALQVDLQADSSAEDQELANSLPPNQVLWLGDDQNRFLALYIPDQSGRPKGGAILLHDAHAHPDWPDVIRPLRTRLPPHGWATLAIRLPSLNNNSEYAVHQPLINTRIQKAAEQLRTLGLSDIVLIGHGSGAMAAATYLANQSEDQGIRAFVGISMGTVKTEGGDESLPSQLGQIKLPILDIFGSRDLASVITTAKIRKLAAEHLGDKTLNERQQETASPPAASRDSKSASIGGTPYRQTTIEGADHNFTGLGEMLSKRVLGWLERIIKG